MSPTSSHHVWVPSGNLWPPAKTIVPREVMPVPDGAFHRISLNSQMHGSDLADIVECISDWELGDTQLTRDLQFKLLPSTVPYIVIPYLSSLSSTRRFGERQTTTHNYTHIVTHHRSGYLTMHVNGPIGIMCIRLQPHAMGRFLGDGMAPFANVKVALTDILHPTLLNELSERLAACADRDERYRLIIGFLRHLPPLTRLDNLVGEASRRLRHDSSLRIGKLAMELQVSERHLSRRFHAVTGMSPKFFARLARMEKIPSIRHQGGTWTDASHACGFTDQSHMINDFQDIVGTSPETFLRTADGDAPCRVTLIRN